MSYYFRILMLMTIASFCLLAGSCGSLGSSGDMQNSIGVIDVKDVSNTDIEHLPMIVHSITQTESQVDIQVENIT